MSPSLQESFERARGLESAEQERFLGELAATDPGLATRVRRLLAAAKGGRSPLDASPQAIGVDPELDEPALLPERIGPYRVVSEIGRGGMGRVYLALHEGEGFSRRLAVKVVSPDGSGPEIERRFREERRILAALEHPGIARFHDAGRDADGRWFLALEYVEGANLIGHARARALSVEERLRLFGAVLEAVAHAHARGVVHRDLKPANILVSTDGRPRLLDFGIAKLFDAGDGVATTQTRTALRAFTPAYASPEQVRGDPVTPASDVFALGVVLYELVAGVRPFGTERGSQAALEREILETDPEPPSTASRNATEPGAVPEIALARHRSSRDLDAICLKALRKEPGERYPSAAELAADVERLLAGLPVVARGDDRRYRLGRYLARHRAAIAVVAALLVAAVAVALAIGTLRRAELPTAVVEPAPQPFPFSGIGAGDVADIETEFTAAPASVETGARLAIALEKAGRHDEAAVIIARLRQIPGRAEDPLIDYVEATVAASSAQPQRALVQFGTALERAIAGGRGELVAQIRASRGRLLHTLGRLTEARADMEPARASFERAGDFASLSRVLNDLAIDPLTNGRLAEGEALLEKALEAARAAGGGGPGSIWLNLGTVSVERGFPDRAEPRFREVVADFRESKSRRLSFALLSLAGALYELGRREEARTAIAEAIALLSESADEGSLAYALRTRGDDELRSGDIDRAAATARELEALAKSRGDRKPLGFSNRLRGEIALARNDLTEARRRFEDARRLHLENAQADDAEDLDVVWAEGELRLGEPAAARAVASRSRPDPAAPIEKNSQFLAEAILARLDVHDGREEEAEQRLERLEKAAEGTTSIRRKSALAEVRAAVGATR